MRRKLLRVFFLVALVCLTVSVHCYAVTEAEVQAAVDSSSKEAVSGNIFVWFLCAIAFMKVSQKIDSFMSSLGISVGRTGGSMMAEIMIAGRAIGGAAQLGGKFAGFGKGNSSGGGTNPTGKSGFFGGIGGKMTEGATGAATGGSSSGGIVGSIGRKMYQNSIGKGGAFAAGVIGSVARGEINKMGTISGANGKTAMESYFGYNSSASVDKKEGSYSSLTVEQGGSTTMSSEENISGTIDMTNGTIPSFSDIEMGGGRITGMETNAEHPDGIQFAMYDAEKYAKPEGKFDTVTAVDNSKWYKQYAAPTVEKTPYMDPKGKVQYNEKIVQKIPKAPMRKDKM